MQLTKLFNLALNMVVL